MDQLEQTLHAIEAFNKSVDAANLALLDSQAQQAEPEIQSLPESQADTQVLTQDQSQEQDSGQAQQQGHLTPSQEPENAAPIAPVAPVAPTEPTTPINNTTSEEIPQIQPTEIVTENEANPLKRPADDITEIPTEPESPRKRRQIEVPDASVDVDITTQLEPAVENGDTQHESYGHMVVDITTADQTVVEEPTTNLTETQQTQATQEDRETQDIQEAHELHEAHEIQETLQNTLQDTLQSTLQDTSQIVLQDTLQNTTQSPTQDTLQDSTQFIPHGDTTQHDEASSNIVLENGIDMSSFHELASQLNTNNITFDENGTISFVQDTSLEKHALSPAQNLRIQTLPVLDNLVSPLLFPGVPASQPGNELDVLWLIVDCLRLRKFCIF